MYVLYSLNEAYWVGVCAYVKRIYDVVSIIRTHSHDGPHKLSGGTPTPTCDSVHVPKLMLLDENLVRVSKAKKELYILLLPGIMYAIQVALQARYTRSKS